MIGKEMRRVKKNEKEVKRERDDALSGARKLHSEIGGG